MSPVDPRLPAARLAALLAGAIVLLAAMLFLEDVPWWRDLAWSAGVALLVLALVANRLIARQARAEQARRPVQDGEGAGRGEPPDDAGA